MKRTIVPRGILTLGLAVVLLAATASTVSAERTLATWYCAPLTPPPTTVWQIPPGCLGQFSVGPGPTSFDFGDRQVGTTSPVQRFALGVWCRPEHGICPDTLNPSIGVSGDYAQTNDCPPTLSANYPGQVQGCVISVTLTPTDTGPKEGTLSTGPGGPTATLTGNGVTTPTPPALPLLLSVGYQDETGTGKALLKKKLTLFATTNYDSKEVVRGGVKKTVAETVAGEPPKTTRFKAKLKHLRRLKESPKKPKVKIKFAATDQFGQTATDELKVRLCKTRHPQCSRAEDLDRGARVDH